MPVIQKYAHYTIGKLNEHDTFLIMSCLDVNKNRLEIYNKLTRLFLIKTVYVHDVTTYALKFFFIRC